MNKAPISALVASFNEGHLLEDCLKSLQFCDEVFVVNLNSKDNTQEIAEKWATRVLFEERDLGYFDAYMSMYVPMLKHDWFILIDPDERIRPELAKDVMEYVARPEPFKSLIRAHIWYFFDGKKMKGGPYRNPIRGRLLFYRPGLSVGDEVHCGITAKPGYGISEIRFTGLNYDEHYWCSSFEQLKSKHTRYSKGEGKVMYDEGKVFSVFTMLSATVRKFLQSYIGDAYYKEGLVGGIRFAGEEARYLWLSYLSLRNYEKTLRAAGQYKTPVQRKMEQLETRFSDLYKTLGNYQSEIEQASDHELRAAMIKQLRKSLHRHINDALELNRPDLVSGVMNEMRVRSERLVYLCGDVLLERVNFVQQSKSYRLARSLANFLKMGR